jgi:hypothetical protein
VCRRAKVSIVKEKGWRVACYAESCLESSEVERGLAAIDAALLGLRANVIPLRRNHSTKGSISLRRWFALACLDHAKVFACL